MPNRRARYFAYVAADSKEIEAITLGECVVVLVSNTGIPKKQAFGTNASTL